MAYRCPQCKGRNIEVSEIIEADPSIGRMDDIHLLVCMDCGTKFDDTSYPPEQSSPFKVDVAVEAKDELLERVQSIVGHEIPNMRWVLRVLAHPDVIEVTKRYFNAMDRASMCTKYEAPWNCAREAEAAYKNIQFGWLGGGVGVGYNEDWCANCRKKVMEE